MTPLVSSFLLQFQCCLSDHLPTICLSVCPSLQQVSIAHLSTCLFACLSVDTVRQSFCLSRSLYPSLCMSIQVSGYCRIGCPLASEARCPPACLLVYTYSIYWFCLPGCFRRIAAMLCQSAPKVQIHLHTTRSNYVTYAIAAFHFKPNEETSLRVYQKAVNFLCFCAASGSN